MLTISNPKTFRWSEMSLHDCCEGNAADTYFTLKLFYLIMDKLEDLGMTGLVENIIAPATEVFAEMEYEGLHVDMNQLGVVGQQLFSKNINQEDELYTFDQVQNTDNLGSNKDLMEVLYTREGAFEFYPPDKTDKGAPSVSAPTLKLLLDQINEELKSR
jgi:DNA polymerase I-like protein with 3'-5' exonuclease and polymerase domains